MVEAALLLRLPRLQLLLQLKRSALPIMEGTTLTRMVQRTQ